MMNTFGTEYFLRGRQGMWFGRDTQWFQLILKCLFLKLRNRYVSVHYFMLYTLCLIFSKWWARESSVLTQYGYLGKTGEAPHLGSMLKSSYHLGSDGEICGSQVRWLSRPDESAGSLGLHTGVTLDSEVSEERGSKQHSKEVSWSEGSLSGACHDHLWMTLCAVLCLVAQSCLTIFDPMDCSLSGFSVHGDSPGKNTTVGCHALLQGSFPTQGSNPSFPHCWQILHHLSHKGSPRILEWVDLSLLQGIFLTQGLNRDLLHCRWILYQLSY